MTALVQHFHVHVYAGRDGQAFESSFEELQERLEELPKAYFEPDGSLLWCPDGDQEIAAMVYDAGGKVQYVDVWGKCLQSSWWQFCDQLSGTLSVQSLQILDLSQSKWQDFQSFEHLTWVAGDGARD